MLNTHTLQEPDLFTTHTDLLLEGPAMTSTGQAQTSTVHSDVTVRREVFGVFIDGGRNYIDNEGNVLPVVRKHRGKQEPWPKDISFFNH